MPTALDSSAARYAIRVTDPSNPNVTIGYVFAAEESFVAAPGGDQIAQDAIAELEATFTTGPTLTAVRLPAGSHETLRGLADPGSAGGGNHN